MADFVIDIINCKADKTDEKWKHHCQRQTAMLRLSDIKACSPITQFEHLLKRQRDQNMNRNDMMHELTKVSNAYHCLLRYAINLCGDGDKSIYKLIKMYTGYYVNNLLSVMEDEAYRCLKDMGYFYKDEYQDELVLSCADGDGAEVYITPAIKDLVKNLFFAYLFCKHVTQLIYATLGDRLQNTDFAEAKWLVRKISECENYCLREFDQNFILRAMDDLKFTKQQYKQKQHLYQQQLYEQQRQEREQQNNYAQSHQSATEEEHMEVDDDDDDDDLYGDNHGDGDDLNSESVSPKINPATVPTPVPRPRPGLMPNIYQVEDTMVKTDIMDHPLRDVDFV